MGFSIKSPPPHHINCRCADRCDARQNGLSVVRRRVHDFVRNAALSVSIADVRTNIALTFNGARLLQHLLLQLHAQTWRPDGRRSLAIAPLRRPRTAAASAESGGLRRRSAAGQQTNVRSFERRPNSRYRAGGAHGRRATAVEVVALLRATGVLERPKCGSVVASVAERRISLLRTSNQQLIIVSYVQSRNRAYWTL